MDTKDQGRSEAVLKVSHGAGFGLQPQEQHKQRARAQILCHLRPERPGLLVYSPVK